MPAFGTFRSVLAQGEGQTTSPSDLAAYEGSGAVPASFTNQQPLYVSVMPHAASLAPSDLDRFYKRTDFGSMPGGVASVESPRAGVQIFRDKKFGMAHVFGATRNDVMWGAGYAQAEERLFMMDAVRRTAEGTLAGLLGPSAAPGDAQQLTDQDFSPQELTAQFNALPQRFGAEGVQAQHDLTDFVAGINARIDEDKLNPNEMPAEYAALGAQPPSPWTVADSAAEAVLLVTQFTVSNGNEQVAATMQEAFQKRFGANWRAPYQDLREAQDPEALTVAKVPFNSDNTGAPVAGLNAMPDFGSIKARNPEVSGPNAQQAAAASTTLPAWARPLLGLRRSFPPVESNAVMVSGRLSTDGRPLAAMGPQVSYYSPQIFSEYELHGGGIDEEGVTFPGASPWALIGHGIDFAWSGTSANGDNQDTFVERLCNPDGSAPTLASTHYMYKGQCTPFLMRDQTVSTPVAPTSPRSPQTITYRTMRSVHGPVFDFATVAGSPVALTKAKAVDFHELDAVVSFMRMAENHPTDARSFMADFGSFPGTENWFYVDNRDVAWQQSGVYPLHARGSDVDLPFWGDGRADWVGFDPNTYTAQYLPPSQRPQALNPPDGFIISWNNKEAPGWRKGPAEWDGGPIQHALILQQRLFDQLHAGGGKTDLTGLTRSVNMTATTDLREKDVYPLMRRVIGTAGGEEEQFLRLLDDWFSSGSQRLAPAEMNANGQMVGSNVYDHSAAIAVMDAWWPRAVSAMFEPILGADLFSTLKDQVLPLPQHDEFGGYDWTSQVWKDLRDVLYTPGAATRHAVGPSVASASRVRVKGHRRQGRRRARLIRHRRPHRRRGGGAVPIPGAYSRIYCGNGSLAACRTALLSSLRDAVADVKARLGSDPSKWQVFATCKATDPPSCDQEVPTAAGAMQTPPFPWQDRGTYHQIDELTGHR